MGALVASGASLTATNDKGDTPLYVLFEHVDQAKEQWEQEQATEQGMDVEAWRRLQEEQEQGGEEEEDDEGDDDDDEEEED